MTVIVAALAGLLAIARLDLALAVLAFALLTSRHTGIRTIAAAFIREGQRGRQRQGKSQSGHESSHSISKG
jgi:hypothetical protein